MTDYAWGPERETFSSQASRVVFNSVIDNPGVGDERNFVRVRNPQMSLEWSDITSVDIGGRYEVYIYFRNDGSSVAEGVKAQSYFTKYLIAGSSSEVVAGIYAQNASPQLVWDGAKFTTSSLEPIELAYIDGSAEFHTMGEANNKTVIGLFGNDGAWLGFDKLDGILQGGMEYAGYITYEVEAREVTLEGEIDYKTIYGHKLSIENFDGGNGSSNGLSTDTQEVIDRSEDALPETGVGIWIPMMAVGAGLLAVLLAAFLLRERENCGKISK